MPALEMAQETGKLIAWKKHEGEQVTKGEILLEVETDKAVVEVEALADGFLAGVTAAPGDVVPVGQTIAWLLASGESVPSHELSSRPAVGVPQNLAEISPHPANSLEGTRTAANRIKVSPKARRVAQEHGIDLTRLSGSGSGGEILVSDVLAARSSAPNAKTASPLAADPSVRAAASASGQALSTVARLMAERTAQSWTTVPHFFLTREVDAGGLTEAKEKLSRPAGASRGVRVTHTDLLIAAVARALEKHPRLNASWTGQAIQYHDEINVGIAMAVEDGVVTGVIRGSNKLDVSEIAAQRSELAERAKSARLHPNDITGATFTISNLGMYHVNAFTAIIVPPQAAILAAGEIADRVVAVDGKPVVRPMISLTLSCDHRVVDGARAAEFMQTLALAMQNLG